MSQKEEMDLFRESGLSKEEVASRERRRKADWITKMATVLSLVAWAVAIAVWAVLESASPDREMRFITTLLNVHHGSEAITRHTWNVTLLPIAFGLLIAALVICFIAFFFNKLRMRRRTDKYRKSVIMIGSITIVGIAAFLIRFGSLFLW